MKYVVTAPLTIGAGAEMRLTKEQAAARRGRLRDLGRGLFAVEAPVEFKAGEVIETAVQLPKASAQLVDVVSDKRAPPKDDARAV